MELSLETQNTLGDPPDSFAMYWLTRFPLLLLHTWYTVQSLSDEVLFRNYYPSSCQFQFQIEHLSVSTVPGVTVASKMSYDSPRKKASANRDFTRYAKYAGFSGHSTNGGSVPRDAHRNLKVENVGLYRNLKYNNTNEMSLPKLEKDVHIFNRKEGKVPRNKNLQRNKKVKASEEPLMWSVNEMKQD